MAQRIGAASINAGFGARELRLLRFTCSRSSQRMNVVELARTGARRALVGRCWAIRAVVHAEETTGRFWSVKCPLHRRIMPKNIGEAGGVLQTRGAAQCSLLV